MRWADLTERERDVAEVARTGASARAIAAQLCLSPRTVETHLGAIYRKLGVGTRAELVARLAAIQPAPALPLPAELHRAELFVGRESELAAIAECLSGVSQPDGRRLAMLIGGEPGVGKSGLVAEAAHRAASCGTLVLAGQCGRDARTPYGPVAQALRPYLAAGPRLDRLGPKAGALDAIMPELAGRLPARLPVDDGATARRLLVEAITDVFATAARGAPVLFVLEDLQWADQATLGLVRRLVSAADLGAVVLLATFRNTELAVAHPLPTLLADLWREPSVRRLDLDGLDRADIATLVRATLGAELTGGDLDRLIADTAGNPFFAVQVLRHRRGVGATGAPLAAVPTSIREVVLARVRELGSAAYRVIEAATVLGVEFDADVLAAMLADAPDAGEDVPARLEAAVAARLIGPGEPGGRFRFAHELVREAVHGEIGALGLARLHRAAGRAIRAVHADDLSAHAAALAGHFAAAAPLGEGVAAARFGLLAAQQALARSAPDDALDVATQALSLLPAGPEHDPLRLELALIEVDSEGTRMDLPAHRAATFRAIDIARRLGDPVALARTVERNTVLPVMGSLDEELLAVKEDAIAALDPQPTPLRARLLVSAAYQRTIGGHGWAAAEHARRAVEDARILNDEDSMVGGLYALAAAAMGAPDLAAQRAVAEELVARGQGRVDLVPERDGRRFRGILRLAGGDRDGFVEDLAGLAEFGERTGSVWVRSLVASWRVLSALLDGDLAAAEQLANAVLAIAGEDPNFMLGWFVQLVHIRRQQDRAGEMAPLAVATLDEHPELVAVRALAASLYVESGDAYRARELLAPLVAQGWAALPGDWLRPATLGYLAPAVRAVGAPEACRSLAAELLPYRGQLLVVGAGSLVVGAADYFRGILLDVIDDPTAVDVLAASVELADRVRAPALATRARVEHASALLRTGAPGPAHAVLTAARADAQRFGLVRSARLAADLER